MEQGINQSGGGNASQTNVPSATDDTMLLNHRKVNIDGEIVTPE